MKHAIGDEMTRGDHASVSNQMYALYAMGKDAIAMKAVVGEEALTAEDKQVLKFHDKFEQLFVTQGEYQQRTIFDSLDICWELLSDFPRDKLTRIGEKVKDQYYARGANKHNDDQIQEKK